jgi:hypothetical protein
MKLDTFPLSNSEKTHYTNWWCRRMGFKSKDLNEHPQIDDVVLLVNWTNEFWDCPKFWKPIIERIWSYVYIHKMPMKKSHIKRLEKITQGMIAWRSKRQMQIEKIRTLRKTVSSL